jgi:hypothetical protein
MAEMPTISRHEQISTNGCGSREDGGVLERETLLDGPGDIRV